MLKEPKLDSSDRRPMPIRKLPWLKSLAGRLAGWGVSPNAISIMGLIAGVAVGFALYGTDTVSGPDERLLWISAVLLIGVRTACNNLDGMVAVEWGKSTPEGLLYNEIPCRIADFAMLVGAGYAAGGHVVLGYLAASGALFTAYVRATARLAGAPSDFGGPMAKPQRMALIAFCAAYLGLAPQGWPFVPAEPGQGLMTWALLVIALGSLLTALLRIRRALQFLRPA